MEDEIIVSTDKKNLKKSDSKIYRMNKRVKIFFNLFFYKIKNYNKIEKLENSVSIVFLLSFRYCQASKYLQQQLRLHPYPLRNLTPLESFPEQKQW